MAMCMLLLVTLGQAICHVGNGLAIVPPSFEEGQDLGCEGCTVAFVAKGRGVPHAQWKLRDEINGRQDAA